jgi:hypothetical protein
MKYLSWDENGPCVLGCGCFVTRFADVPRDVQAGPTADYGHGE